MTISEWKSKIDIAVNNFSSVRDVLISRSPEFEDELEAWEPVEQYTPALDLGKEIRGLSSQLQFLQILREMQRFHKLDDVLFEAMLSGDSANKIVGTVKHKVKYHETLPAIAAQYGVNWETIAEYNGIVPAELVEGMEIYIPYPIEKTDIERIFTNNPVFDAHIGIRALGTDLRDDIGADLGTTPDMQVLNYSDTFRQGIHNIIKTRPGEIPDMPSWGFDDIVGEDMLPDNPQTKAIAEEEFLKLKLKSALLQDSRVEQVISVMAVRNGEGWIITALIKPINSPTAIEFTEPTGDL